MSASGRYVIVGGGGYLGAKVISRLQSEGFNGVIVVVDPNPQKFETIEMDQSKILYVKSSFLDQTVLDGVLKDAIAVFHLASIGHTGLAANDRKYVFDFNVEGTKLLMRKFKEYGVSRFLYASSVAVAFIGVPLDNATENDPLPHPTPYLDYYSESKAEAEAFVLSQSTDQFKTVALRFRAIYGPEDPNVTKKVANLIDQGLFLTMVSVHGRESISMASSGQNCSKAFALADKMLQKPNGIHGRVYYILDEESVGQYQFWEPLVSALGRKPPVWFFPYKLLEVVTLLMSTICYNFFRTTPLLTKFELMILATDNTYSIERARQELGYQPEPCDMHNVAAHYKKLGRANAPTVFTRKFIFAIFLVLASIFIFRLYN
uniref:3Beta_HSD domain-containing protein n=1 Tax=Caenorhabditis tropicalis TaxID=1561998 RepID=A0A1I7SZH4_9PELO